MDKFEEIANEIIDDVSDVIEEHYGVEPKHITDDDSIESPALINGTVYYELESHIADKIKEKALKLENHGTIIEALEDYQRWFSENDPDDKERRDEIEKAIDEVMSIEEGDKFSKKEKETLRKALNLLIEEENDTVDHTSLFEKIGIEG